MSTTIKPGPKSAVLNLDALLAEHPTHFIEYGGEQHPIAQLSVATFLRYEQLRGALESPDAEGGAARSEAETVALLGEVLGLLVPTLPDDVKELPMSVYMQMVQFVMAHVETPTAEKDGEAGAEGEQPGE